MWSLITTNFGKYMIKQAWNQSPGLHLHTHVPWLPLSWERRKPAPEAAPSWGVREMHILAREDKTLRVLQRNWVVHSFPSLPSPKQAPHFEMFHCLTMGKCAIIKSERGNFSRNPRSVIAGILGFGWEGNWYQVVLSTSPNGLLFPGAWGTQKGNKGWDCIYGSLPGYLSQFPL